MLEIDYAKDVEPSTRGEKITRYVFLILILIGFTLELVTNYEPKKLSAIVFIFAWIPLTFLHEMGHAIIARLVGWEVNEFVVGFGKILKEFRYGRTKVELRMIPIGGYILPGSTELNWTRWRSALVYCAGPGIELAVFLAIYAFIGFEKFLNPSTGCLDLVLQGIGLSSLTGAVLNLIPHSAITAEGETPNDGLGIFLSLFGRRGYGRNSQ